MRTEKSVRWQTRFRSGFSCLALSLLATPQLLQAEAPAMQADHRSGIAGVWQPVGVPLLDPAAADFPDNKGWSTSEMRQFPPYNAEYEARYARIIARVRKGEAVDDSSARCLPQGMPRMMVINYPIDIVVQPHRVVMLFEPLGQRRIIHTDGRKHTDPDILDPTFAGESIGHWEGDTLVVSTIGLRDDTVLDVSVAPHSDALRFEERIRMVGDTLEDQIMLHDPKAFTKPWQITRVYKRNPRLELKEFFCENNRAE